MKHSIARQISAVFIGLMLLVLAANMLANGFFLERFYLVKLQKTLVHAYELLDEHISGEGMDTSYFSGEFSKITTANNLSLVVVNQDYEILLSTRDGNSEIMAARIWGYEVGADQPYARVLKKTSQYTIQQMEETKQNMSFLEMWGELTSGYYFMMRIPMQSISANVKISNEFMLGFSIVAVVVSILLIMWLSKRITSPIRELTGLSERMANLDFDVRYTSGGKNEIGQLGDHFNRMSEKLEQTISELKSANNELQRDIEHKTQIDDMRKEFLSNVSHELKTPLALIQGYAEGLKECINDDEQSREFYCDVIMDEASKMNTMVKKLLTLNELEFGGEQARMERFDIAQLISGKLASIQILADQKEAEMSYEGVAPLQVWGDELRVEEVLTNYLSNALNHVEPLPETESEPERSARIVVSSRKTDGRVRISVFNTGKPVPEEDLDRIWDKFYKVDKARTREYGGSGVGLSIVRAIMDSMNGGYGVENTDDGVIFWFELEEA
ncbi:MAG: HAMP domain-containing protein [Lachnospiraceae bacterium]|nr:HAMP domain-containing protein [Lachnospiraceae bacterium]